MEEGLNNRQRGLDWCRRTIAQQTEEGYHAETVERFNPRTFQSQDLWGCWDIISVGPELRLVQVTSRDNMAARAKKIADSDVTPLLRNLGVRLLIQGYYKLGQRWQSVVKDVS